MLKKRMIQIDNLRGFTAILIAVFHIFFRYNQIYHPGMEPTWMQYFGDLGNHIFIIISGFFLFSMNDVSMDCNNKKSLLNYLVKRIIRLWPLYFICITITWVTVRVFGLPGREVSISEYILNIPFINGFISKPYVDGAHWYLTTIVAIIFVYGVINHLLNKGNDVWLFIVWLIVCDVLLLCGKPGFAQFLGGQYLGCALCGLSLRKIIMDGNQRNKYQWGILVIISFVSTFLVKGMVGLICQLVGLLVVILAVFDKLKCVDNPIGKWLSSKSFALYLIHQNIAYVFIFKTEEIVGSYKVWMSVVAFVLVILISVFLSRLEKCIKYKIDLLVQKS